MESEPATSRAALLSDLEARMESLYRTGAYYLSVPPGDAGSADAYWGEIVDPDGRVRDRRREREQAVADLAEELAYVASLDRGAILDVGCGLGFFLGALDDGWDKHGVELSPEAAAHAGRFGQVVQGVAEALPYPDGRFDVVFCHHVIEHLAVPERGLTELRRVLADGGHLVLGTPDFDSAAARRFGGRYRLLHDPTHVSLFSNDSMHRFLRDHGFAIQRVRYPFFDTRHCTPEAFERLRRGEGISPAAYGSFMTFYALKVP
jgi:SAM-dependent methyltransferase